MTPGETTFLCKRIEAHLKDERDERLAYVKALIRAIPRF